MDKDDINKVVLGVGIAFDLIKAGNQILQLIKDGQELDEVELLELIEMHDQAKSEARNSLIQSIKARKGL